MLFLPLLTKNVNDTEYSIYTNGLQQQLKGVSGSGVKIELTIIPLALNIAAAVFCFASIFFFKNRGLQKRVIMVAILMVIAIAVLCGIQSQQFPGGTEGISAAGGSFLPLLAILFSLLAIGGIRKDELLLKSADRLR
ncbi:DUF4293 domain-containing protein [Pedobacter heparinus]|uniref:DUF4293 domain-containing protein n=1 Tax=Pedobacter heparinus TaxID=984 RepID=UPI002931EC55|nr:DUF4293 domain-containing protein [Pedobacter heparinus]